MSYVPVIDISLLDAPEGRTSVAAKISNALEHVGFMCLVGHGIPDDLLDRVENYTKTFFNLPDSVKQTLLRTRFNSANPNQYKGYFPTEENVDNKKEGFDIGITSDPDLVKSMGKFGMFWENNVWPDELLVPGFRACMEQYAQAVQKLGLRLLSALAEVMHLDSSYFEQYFTSPLSVLRLLHYPPYPNPTPGSLSCSEHTDSGVMTFVLQDDVGCLQVRDQDDGWHDVVPLRHSFVVNTGDLFELWTGGRFRATVHRVLATDRDRYSVPFFHLPNGNARIREINGGNNDSQGLLYAEYLYEKITQNFLEYSRDQRN